MGSLNLDSLCEPTNYLRFFSTLRSISLTVATTASTLDLLRRPTRIPATKAPAPKTRSPINTNICSFRYVVVLTMAEEGIEPSTAAL
jgi:hypothetical protein